MGLVHKISRLFSFRNERTPELVRVCDCEKFSTVNKKLIKAAKSHHVNCVKKYLKEGANVNAKKMGRTALDYLAEIKEKHTDDWGCWNQNFGYYHFDKNLAASRHGCLHALLEAGAEVKPYTSLLSIASLAGCEECVDLLLKVGISVDSDGITLHLAVQEGHHKCLELLLKARANVNVQQYMFNYTLFYALHHKVPKCLETLIQAGADVNFPCCSGGTPTIVAASYGYDKGLEVLVNAGADVNKRDWRGFTALMKASHNGNRSCVDLLLNAGADVKMCSVPEGLTALQLSTDGGCIKLLLDAGAYVNEPLPNGGTAVIRAVCNGNTDSMKVLIEAGADVNATMCYRGDTLCYGVTALHHSDRFTADVSGGKHLLGIKLLLSAGAKVNMLDSKGRNALTGYIDNAKDYVKE